MLFPFRTSAIFRNRWVALLWAAGICFMASEIVDSVAGITGKSAPKAIAEHASTPSKSDDAVAAVLDAPTPLADKPVL